MEVPAQFTSRSISPALAAAFSAALANKLVVFITEVLKDL